MLENADAKAAGAAKCAKHQDASPMKTARCVAEKLVVTAIKRRDNVRVKVDSEVLIA